MPMMTPAADYRVRARAAVINRRSNKDYRELTWDVIHLIDKQIDRVMKSTTYDGGSNEIRYEWVLPEGMSDDSANSLVTDVVLYLNANGYYCGVKPLFKENKNINWGVELHVSWA